MKLFAFMLKQDDPNKCTAAKLAKFGLIIPVNYIPRSSIVLNPYSDIVLSKKDASIYNSICAIDCSWNCISSAMQKLPIIKNKVFSRKLPLLLAGNPVNYAKIGKLSTVEALSGSLYIMGFNDIADSLLNKFKWGHTFNELNRELFKDYNSARSCDEIIKIEKEYFPNIY
ncbi:MAG: DUF367 family protein [Nitrososphaeraceae archaeon]